MNYDVYTDGASGQIKLPSFRELSDAEEYAENLSSRPDWREIVEPFVSPFDPKQQHAFENARQVVVAYQGRLEVELPLRFR